MWRFSRLQEVRGVRVVGSVQGNGPAVSRGAPHQLGMHRHQVEHDGSSRGVANEVDRLCAEVLDESGQVVGVLSNTPRPFPILAPAVTAPIPGHHLRSGLE